MAERKFTRGLSKPGSAAQVRETVSQAVRETSGWAKPQLVEPLDYETYIIKNKTIIQNDPQRDIINFPLDDVSQEIIPRTNRTVVSTIPSGMEKENISLFVRECIKTYTISFHVVKYKYDAYSGTFFQLARLPKSCDLQDQVYEIDTAPGNKDGVSLGSSQRVIVKEGYVFKGPESGTDSFLSIATKSFKKRYMSLRKEVDGTHTLEFYKDESKSESKGSFSMEFCNKVVQISKRNKWSFALQMGDSHKSCVLAVENEEELESWIATLTAAISVDKHTVENNKKCQVEVEDSPPVPSPCPTNYGTLKSLEHSKNPELVKYSRETDYSITEARKENRQNIFAIYPDMQVTLQPPSCDYERNVDPPKDEFKMRILVKFEEIKFKLQVPSAGDKGSVSHQLEPYFTCMTIYDAKEGRKVVEDFKFDINDSHMCQMLPNRCKMTNDQNEDVIDPSEIFSNVKMDWLSSAKQALFSVKNPHPDLYLVVRIEKVLQGSIYHAAEPYFRPNDARAAAKVQKLAKLCCQHLSRYRMPFAWAARPIFRPFTKELDVSSEISPIFRYDSSKLGEEDFLKILSDFRKPDKLKHLAIIPGAVKISICAQTDPIPNTLTTSLLPVVPFPIPPTTEPTIEIQEYFTDVAKESFPFNSYINHLYVCPRSLKYDNQKVFTKARNISCVVEIRESDDIGAQSLRCIYGRPGEPPLVTAASTAVAHHVTCPDFYEEVKIRLPPHLHEKHHLLFTFYHVSCHLPKASKKKEGPVEVVIGYSWLPLLSKGRLNLDEHILPVSSHIPAGYLSFQPFGLGKGFCGPEIRWVENGKELFKVGLKLISTIYCKDHHLYNFFVLCEKFLDGKLPAPEAEINTSLKALHAVDMSTIINFLPTIVNQLMQLLVCTSSEGIALNTVRVLIHMVNGIHEAEKGNILRSYIQYLFIAENISSHHQNSNTTVHEKLAKYLAITLRPANTDFLVINNFLKHSWFFFQLLTKSMAQHLLSSGRIKMQRHERFPADYQYRIQNLLQVMVSHIFQKYQDIPLEARQANQSLAYFIKKCFTFMDRGFVFKLINFYLEKYCCADDVQILHEYKFEFLEIVSSHEHFIALNLPILHRTIYRGQTKNIKDSIDDLADYEQEYWLSEQFCQHHFLVGVLLQEIKAAMADTNVRKVAISVLCNLLAKHSFDDRYQGRAQQARIASLYLPFIPIIMDNIKLLDTCEIGSPSSHKLNGIEELFSEAVPSTPTHHVTPVSRCNTMTAESLLLPTISGRSNRDSSYLTFIAGQGLVSKRSINGSHGSLDSGSSTPSSVSDRGHEYFCKDRSDKVDKLKMVLNGGGHTRSQSFPFGSNTGLSKFEKVDSSEIKHLLVCFLYIVKNVSEELIIGWWHHCSESDVLNFFHVLEFCLHQFKYVGKKHIRNQNTKKSNSKAMTLPARIAPLWIPQHGNSTFCETHSVSPTSESDNTYRALLEANMATEVGLIALDVLGQYCFHFKENLLVNDGDNGIMQKIFDIYLSFLQVGQSETLLKHLFASLRAFINKFPVALFQGSDLLCGKLCFELLRCCSSKLSTVRNEACALLYLLMRSNFEFTRHQSLTRVHLQLIVAVSQLLGDMVGLNSTQFQESLSVVNYYSNSDKAMQHSAFPSQVKDLTKRIRTVLMATVQMKEHENDPEMFIDLQHQLANSYSATPALRKTWLESMARNHIKNGDYSEAAHCFIHIAALQAEYLRQKGLFPKGCQAFRYISPNIEQDESNMKEDCGNQEIQYTEDSLLESLEQCVTLLDQAERYEIIAEVYKLIIPVYERRRNYEALTASYKKLYSAFSKVVEVNKTGKRLLGRYYRVAFFGQAYFGDESGKEYIYKEPKITSLVEVSERLHQLFCEKFGKDVVKMIMDSNQVSSRDLDSKYAYIQVTHVVPYFDEDELRNRITEFERNNNLRCFMFETPFTKDETKPRGNPEEQLKRQTIVKALYSFPYVKKRIPVFSKTIQVLSPIEVAIDEMNCRVKELQDVVCTKPTDLKKLQLKLQGSISVQVNAGPLAYAKAFLDENKVRRYPLDKVLMLKDVYQLFIGACQEALDLNGKLIISDQHEYHSVLKVNFQEMVTGLSSYLNNQVFADDSGTFRRTSLDVFSFISGSSTA